MTADKGPAKMQDSRTSATSLTVGSTRRRKAMPAGATIMCPRSAACGLSARDPNELLQGARAYEFLKDEAEMIGGRVAIEVKDVEAFEEGPGLGLALPEITLAGGLKVSPRWSAVFHKEGVDWKLVQLHASVAQANEAAFGDTSRPEKHPPAAA